MNFRMDFTTHDAAKYSVENWHYSRCLPTGKLIKIGVWENEIFIGVIIYSAGACPQIAKPFNLDRMQVCELTRIALNKHINPVSKYLSISILMLKKKCPLMKMIISYADPEQDHHGGVYQASNWVYLGETNKTEHFISDKGFRIHSKTLRTGNKGLATKMLKEGKIRQVFTYKHKYIYPLTKDLYKLYKQQSKPYPMRKYCNGSIPVVQTGGGVQSDLSAPFEVKNA